MKLTQEQIDHIITYEVVVDCYDDHEVYMGWAIYMGDNINYPFEAEYEVKKKSGEYEWKKVMVVGSETDDSNFSGGNYYVEIEINDMVIPANLDKLRNLKADEETMKTLQVWQNRSI